MTMNNDKTTTPAPAFVPAAIRVAEMLEHGTPTEIKWASYLRANQAADDARPNPLQAEVERLTGLIDGSIAPIAYDAVVKQRDDARAELESERDAARKEARNMVALKHYDARVCEIDAFTARIKELESAPAVTTDHESRVRYLAGLAVSLLDGQHHLEVYVERAMILDGEVRRLVAQKGGQS